ncbi:flagella synthesis protein FlgN [Legionella shakespearei]|uniref:Flagellar biosynthesis/type III secretory pathway chaperone n=1 Tax=Legionella shakespearei DSM 23087 TaxID=1122169 RepID=A0A0W0Z0Z6_9GAMM|nr:flagellar protein FlgN [Legionella shakespearei]KTD62832.1 flagellar biosynthesis/type III secretory pathway chaperone [Legionella shakespearei DSM 23087]
MNNNNNNAKTLAGYLEQEINWVEALNTLLAEERTILEASQFEQLEPLADKKHELSSKLEESARQRMELIHHSDTNTSSAVSLNEFLQGCSNSEAIHINQLHEKLVTSLATCRSLNTINGQVIASNLHTRQQIVNALSGNNAEAVSVYTANGNLKSSNDNSHHQEA